MDQIGKYLRKHWLVGSHFYFMQVVGLYEQNLKLECQIGKLVFLDIYILLII